jgi:hypothetical protein
VTTQALRVRWVQIDKLEQYTDVIFAGIEFES